MRKKWKRYKNKIMALGMALSISCSSVFLPGMEVMASDTTTEYEDLIEGKVAVDKNQDGVLTLDEVNLLKLIPYSFTSLGKWYEMGKLAVIESTQTFKDWTASGLDMVVGWVANSGVFTLSDDTIRRVVDISNEIRGDNGYTVYPALPYNQLHFLNKVNASTDSINGLEGYWDSVVEPYGPIGYNASNNTFRLYAPERARRDLNYVYDKTKAIDYVMVKENNKLYYYCLTDSGTLDLVDRFKGSYYVYVSPTASGYTWTSSSSTTDYFALNGDYPLIGFMSSSRIVFDSLLVALDFYNHNMGYHTGSGGSFRDDITLDILNNYDWTKVNSDGYSKIHDDLMNSGLRNDEEILSLIDEYTKEVMSSLEFIEQEQVEQAAYLKGIYELLKEWFPKLFNKDTNVDVDVDVNIEDNMGQFDDESNNQSDKLDDLILDSQVEKPDIDSTNQLVDENLDMGNVEEYGTLLSVFTGNQRILSFILISLTVGLIAYVFYGKR